MWETLRTKSGCHLTMSGCPCHILPHAIVRTNTQARHGPGRAGDCYLANVFSANAGHETGVQDLLDTSLTATAVREKCPRASLKASVVRENLRILAVLVSWSAWCIPV